VQRVSLSSPAPQNLQKETFSDSVETFYAGFLHEQSGETRKPASMPEESLGHEAGFL
jgi:hypothetical protein